MSVIHSSSLRSRHGSVTDDFILEAGSKLVVGEFVSG